MHRQEKKGKRKWSQANQLWKHNDCNIYYDYCFNVHHLATRSYDHYLVFVGYVKSSEETTRSVENRAIRCQHIFEVCVDMCMCERVITCVLPTSTCLWITLENLCHLNYITVSLPAIGTITCLCSVVVSELSPLLCGCQHLEMVMVSMMAGEKFNLFSCKCFLSSADIPNSIGRTWQARMTNKNKECHILIWFDAMGRDWHARGVNIWMGDFSITEYTWDWFYEWDVTILKNEHLD